ncbi:MAG: S1C family serine protease [Betaproteobacteria bacterium]|jgi:S1-C subfamily serine protease|nr:S1C family serine protease [Betaproteobacteria bacterium]
MKTLGPLLGPLIALVLPLALLPGMPVEAQENEKGGAPSAGPSRGDAGTDAGARAEGLVSAVVRVRMTALPDARTSETLGSEREGTGVVIDDEGHVLTIGYLVLEPDSIEVTTASNKTVPARLLGYDHATGFGLLEVQGALDVKPVVLGNSDQLPPREPVMVLPWGGPQAASVAYVVSRREFTGAWEYLLDNAIFVSPPTRAWAGAALVNREYKLVGIGSLLVRDTVPGDRPMPGNMFVPINLLKPILADLKSRGRAAGAPRPWLGLRTESARGKLFVTGVSEDGPADLAGIERGDIVLAVGSVAVATQGELYRKMWALGPAGTEVPLRILRRGEAREIRVKSIDRSAFFRSKPAY